MQPQATGHGGRCNIPDPKVLDLEHERPIFIENGVVLLLKDALLPWPPARHMLYHAEFKKAVRTLMLVHRSLQKGVEIPVPPREGCRGVKTTKLAS